MFIQKLLRLVDLGRQVRTPTTIRMVEKHKLAMLLADLILVQAPLPVVMISKLNPTQPKQTEANEDMVNVLEFQDQARFTTSHPRFEAPVTSCQTLPPRARKMDRAYPL